ncbi:Hypothetical_protein [Hexamita inflata]|uniref:Hypothetical_protein n=1 Tax=Hexamita inflata TaxID=28002 RepID=A0AA86PLF6_9EUKA|nr:Hypothetical protein HINF_LOCUS28017 [Hexamita inflata]
MICPSWMKNCVSMGYTNIALIIISTILMLSIVFSAIAMLFKLKNVQKTLTKTDLKRQLSISFFLIMSAVLRTGFWFFDLYVFRPNSAPYVSTLVLNRLSILCLYQSQSIFVKCWLLDYVRYSISKTQRRINYVFVAIDSFITFIMLTSVLFAFFDYSYGAFSYMAQYIIVFSSFITSSSFIIIGTIVTKNVTTHFDCCSAQVQKFIFTASLLVTAALCRCITFIVQTESHLSENLISVFCYVVPEVIPAVVILISQFQMFKYERRVEEHMETKALLETDEY